MATVRLKHVNSFRDRHGRVRHYVRLPGRKAVPLPGLPGSEAYMSAYAVALADLDEPEIGEARTKRGTLNAAIVAYYGSDAFKAVAPITQANRRAILERVRLEHGDKRFALLHPEHVNRLLHGLKPYAARNRLKALRALMRFAVEVKLRSDDPTVNVKLARVGKTVGFIAWSDAEIKQYRDCHALGTVARVALELMLNVAARRGDACILGRQHVKNGRLSWRPHKTRRSTGRKVTVPILPELQGALDAVPSDAMTFLTTDLGKPFASPAAFGNKFADWCKHAGLQDRLGDDGVARSLRAHGLRKSALRRLAEAGASAVELMSVSGHATISQVQVYIDEVDRERMAQSAMARISKAGAEG
jgi:integrase